MTHLNHDEFFVDSDISQALSLPAQSFSRSDVLQCELRTVFEQSWLMAPEPEPEANTPCPARLTSHVKEAKDFYPLDIHGRPVYMHRGTDGTLRAFPNVCTHAWYPVVTKPGNAKTVLCGQHGRRFDMMGRYAGQPRFDNMPDFPRACDHLSALHVETWKGLCFVCLDEPRFSFSDVFTPVSESVEHLGVERFERVAHDDECRIVDGNWKQHACNFMDKFHIPFIHRGPNGLVDHLHYPEYVTELHKHAALQWAWSKKPEHGFDPALLPQRFTDPTGRGRRVLALWWFIYPNLTLNFYPWGLSINRYEPTRDDPNKTRFVWNHFVMDQQKYEDRERIWQNTRVDNEDVDAMTLVREGIGSGWAPRGRFAPGDEAGPHWFHRLTYEHLFGSSA